jgi:transcriptional regulator with XRE-family HTH domain
MLAVAATASPAYRLSVGKTGPAALRDVLDAAERRLGSKKAVAEKIGITPSRYSKLYGGNDYSLSVLNCLTLAKATERSPSAVLRAAGKHEIATLLDELYGPERPAAAPDADALDWEVFDLMSRIAAHDQKLLARDVVKRLAPKSTAQQSARPQAPTKKR